MTSIPAYLERARMAMQTIAPETGDEIRSKSKPTTAPNADPHLSLRADVLALAEARGWPWLLVDDVGIVGAPDWIAVMQEAPPPELTLVRAALLTAQRRDGSVPSRVIAVTA